MSPARPYSAVGDGTTDDTAALQRAINDNTGKRSLIYFPNGTYLVSAPLTIPLNDTEGHTLYGFTNLQGQSRDGVVLRLKDHTFTDPGTPPACSDLRASQLRRLVQQLRTQFHD